MGEGKGKGLKNRFNMRMDSLLVDNIQVICFYEGQRTHQRINLARMKQDKHSILSATVNARQILIGRYLRCLQITN